MIKMSRYKVARYGNDYVVLKWFDEVWVLWIKTQIAGWYSTWLSWDTGWTQNLSDRYVSKFDTIEDAYRNVRERIQRELPPWDMEPVSLGSDGEALRQGYLDEPSDSLRQLVYADWLDEHGYSKSAYRLRLEVEIFRNAVIESEGHDGRRDQEVLEGSV